MEDIMLEMRAIEQLKNRIDVIELLFAFYIFTTSWKFVPVFESKKSNIAI
jgi:hypothetical protein